MESFFKKYKNWILQHPEDGKKIEEYLRLAAYLVPSFLGISSLQQQQEQYHSNLLNTSNTSMVSSLSNTTNQINIISELLYSCSNILSLYHDTLIGNNNNNSNTSKIQSVQWFLSILSSIDILGEVIATLPWKKNISYSQRSSSRYKFIFGIEFLRVLCKLYILIHSNERIQQNGGQITLPLQNIAPTESSSSPSPPPSSSSSSQQWWHGNLTGITLPLPKEYNYSIANSLVSTPSSSNYSSFLSRLSTGITLLFSSSSSSFTNNLLTTTPTTTVMKDILLQYQNNTSSSDNNKLSMGGIYNKDIADSLFLIGELLYIIRPLVYVLCLPYPKQPNYPLHPAQYYKEESILSRYLPLTISILVDILASQTTRAAAYIANGDSGIHIPSLLSLLNINFFDTTSNSSGTLNTKNITENTVPSSILQNLQQIISSSPIIGPYFRGFTNTPSQASDELLFNTLTLTSSTESNTIPSTTIPTNLPIHNNNNHTIPIQTIKNTAPILSTLLRLGLWFKEEIPNLTINENIEIYRRYSLYKYYLLRGPIYSSITQPIIHKLINKLSWFPIVGSILLYGEEVMQYMHEHHFCSSASQ